MARRRWTPGSSDGARGRRSEPRTGRPGSPCSPTTPWWQDPIGPSPFDPEGQGHRGKEAIAAFYDTVIAPSERVEFEMATVLPLRRRGGRRGHHPHHPGRGDARGRRALRLTYRTDGKGKLVALRAYWEFEALELVEA